MNNIVLFYPHQCVYGARVRVSSRDGRARLSICEFSDNADAYASRAEAAGRAPSSKTTISVATSTTVLLCFFVCYCPNNNIQIIPPSEWWSFFTSTAVDLAVNQTSFCTESLLLQTHRHPS